jgi:cytochrome c-type biogenesis protein CcmH/NrfG
LTNTLKKYPYDDKLWLYLAIVEYRQKNTDDAKTAISNAYQINPNYTNAYYYYKINNNQPVNIKINTIPKS